MNGIHDMGGMHGMGPIEHEREEPTFHAPWEGRVYALSRVLRARGGRWNLDAFRHGIELLPPADYLRMT
jgi:nitrile hydratase